MSKIAKPRPQGNKGKSPFRYPGGKAILLPEIFSALTSCRNDVVAYAEPYAGGAGAAIELLAMGAIDRIFLNDADIRIYSAWEAMLLNTEAFIQRLQEVEVNIEQWREFYAIVNAPETARDRFELGFATFFLNRTNRSGIVQGAGPIGGYEQTGKWKIDARFYRDTMIERVRWLGEKREQISLSNFDGVEFIRTFNAAKARATFFFIDPPYVDAGSRLYLNQMNSAKHRELATLMKRKKSMENWMMTYDNHPLIWEQYRKFNKQTFSLNYTLQSKRIEKEIVIRPSI